MFCSTCGIFPKSEILIESVFKTSPSIFTTGSLEEFCAYKLFEMLAKNSVAKKIIAKKRSLILVVFKLFNSL